MLPLKFGQGRDLGVYPGDFILELLVVGRFFYCMLPGYPFSIRSGS